MAETYGEPSGDLENHGLECSGNTHWNLSAKDLIDLAVQRKEGVFSAHKALVTETGERTGRSPNDKFIVDEPTTSSAVSYTHLRAHETVLDLVCRLLLEKKKLIM